MSQSDNYVDALRLSADQQKAIIDDLEFHSALAPEAKKRRNQRYRYVVREGIIVQPQDSQTRFVVRPRNISEGGISFLHGSFFYPGTVCILTLRTVDNEQVLARGTVVRCRCVQGRVHEVGVQFEKPIDVHNFVSQVEDPPDSTDGSASPAAGNGQPTDYEVANVVELAQQLQELALSRAPRSKLYRTLAQLVALLRNV